jgi:hypothetical protein
LIGGTAPPATEIPLRSRLVIAIALSATRTVALARPRARFVLHLIEQSQCKPKRRPLN